MKIYTQKELEAIQLWRLRKLAKETHNIDFKTDTKIKLKSDLISEFLQIQQSKINEMKGKNKSNKEILESLALALLINERDDKGEAKEINTIENVVIQIGRNGGNLATWQGESTDDYPIWKSPKIKRKTIEINSNFLKEGLERTIKYCGKDDLRPAMTGINIEVENETIKFVSTDAHKLAVQILHKRERNFKTFGFDKTSFIIPQSGAKILINCFKSSNVLTEMYLYKNSLTVSFDNVRFKIRLIDDKYPNYNAVIPSDNDKILYVNRKELISALKMVAISTNKATNQIRFALNRVCELTAQDLDFNLEQKEFVKDFCFSQNELFEIAFNGKFLTEILSDISTEYVNIEMSKPNRAALVVPVELNRHTLNMNLLMPVLINS